MGFIKAFAGALGGTFADSWKDFIGPDQSVPSTAAIFPAVPYGTNAGRGSNTKGSANIITNGSKILVPEGTALVTLQDGAITGLITEVGGFTWTSDDPNSQSFFSGAGLGATLKQSWERFKFGGIPGSQQMAVYVNLKEIPNNRFGTQNPIRWKDPFTETKMGAIARGTYTLKIVDPILFLKNYVPNSYIQGGDVFDFGDMDNPAGEQLFNEVVSCLAPTFVSFSRSQGGPVEIEDFQGDQLKLGRCLSDAVEEGYQWRSDRGLEVGKVAIMSLDYDEASLEILEEARKADVEIRQRRKMGAAYSENMAGMMAAASGEAMQNAAGNPNGAMMGFMGMNMAGQMGANVMGAATNMQQQIQQQQPQQPQQPVAEPQQPAAAAGTQEDPYEKLAKLKKLLDDGIISQEEFDEAKKKVLGV